MPEHNKSNDDVPTAERGRPRPLPSAIDPAGRTTQGRGNNGSSNGRRTKSADGAAAPASEHEQDAVSQFEQTQEQSDLDRLAQLLEQLGATTGTAFSAYLHRNKRPGLADDFAGYLGSLEFGADFLDDVVAVHGGGHYRARIHDARGKYKTSFTFTIAGAPKRLATNGSAAAVGGAAQAEPSADSSGSRLDRLERLVERLLEGTTTAKTSPLHDAIEIMKAAKELLPAPAPAQSTKEMLASMNELLEFHERMDERTGGGNGGSDFAVAVEHGVRPLVQTINRSLDIKEKEMDRRRARAALPATTSTAAPIAPASAVGGAASGTSEQAASISSGDPVAQLGASIPKLGRSFLRSHAEKDHDPESYAVMVLDTVQESSPQLYAHLPALLERADFLDVLLAAVPEWAPFRPWFSELVGAMRGQLAEDAADHAADHAAARDAGDDAGDASSPSGEE